MPSIYVGGVPFGCDNVGDEAILECAIRILRETAPEYSLTVATNDPATGEKLGVNTTPLLGFKPPRKTPPDEFAKLANEVSSHDVFFWCGATGLSDYPERPVFMLNAAQKAGRKTILWGVGMNSELNPAMYTMRKGTAHAMLNAVKSATFGAFDPVAMVNRRLDLRARRMIQEAVSRADLIVVRDPESREELIKSGVKRPIIVGADSAIILEPTSPNLIHMPDACRAILDANKSTIGVCISAQRKISSRAPLVDYLDRLVADDSARILFIPMNPVTDATLMSDLHRSMKQPDRAAVLEGRYEPAEILAVAARMDVVVSSRLHLLILAAVRHVPIIGISRGSKVDNFLGPFGLKAAGSVDECDFAFLFEETQRLLNNRADFEERSQSVRSELLKRLDEAKMELRQVLTKENGTGRQG